MRMVSRSESPASCASSCDVGEERMEEKATVNARRSNKPIMEKRRRARINNCLNELKALILEATKKDASRHSKLEKADILEMTLKHLQDLQSAQAKPSSEDKYRQGFTECALEVSRYPGLEPSVRHRLLHHLAETIDSSTETNEERTAPCREIKPAQREDREVRVRVIAAKLVPAGTDVALLVPEGGQTAPLALVVDRSREDSQQQQRNRAELEKRGIEFEKSQQGLQSCWRPW